MGRKWGAGMNKTRLSGPGIPSEERMKLGPVACIECLQQIPCNPCEEACPRGAITVGKKSQVFLHWTRKNVTAAESV